MPDDSRHKLTVAFDNEELRILRKFGAKSIPYEIEQSARKAMRRADKIEGEAFDRLMSRKPSSAQVE